MTIFGQTTAGVCRWDYNREQTVTYNVFLTDTLCLRCCTATSEILTSVAGEKDDDEV